MITAGHLWRVVLACLLMLGSLFAPASALAADLPASGFEGPYFDDPSGVFGESQTATLARDALLLQSTGIPALVYVQNVSADQATPEHAQPIADKLRQDRIVSWSGEDNGLVILLSFVEKDRSQSSIVFSYGAHSFDGTGLSPEDIQASIDTSAKPYIEKSRTFEAMVFVLRESRYNGIYSPPPIAERTSAQAAVNSAMNVLAPAITVGLLAWFAAWSSRLWSRRLVPAARSVWLNVLGSVAVMMAVWALSVYGRNRIGILCVFLMLGMLALFSWLWTNRPFTVHHASPLRTLAVAPSVRRTRRLRHARSLMERGVTR